MVKVGIIGSGFGLYGLVPAFYSLKKCQIVAVCANNQERLQKYYFSRGLKNVYSDWRKMLESEKLDALAIAVTPAAQYEIANVAIQKGLHIFAEKPLADTYSHAVELLDLAKQKSITHAVDFLFPEIGAWRKIKKILDDKTYGKLKHISVNWDFLSLDIKNQISTWKTDAAKGGGAVAFYFCHSLYSIEYFAGEVADITSSLINSQESVNGAEVGVDLLIKFKKNILGSAHISCNTRGLNRHQFIFRCEKATLILENSNSFVRNFNITIYTDHRELLVFRSKLGQSHEDEEKAKVDLVKKIAQRFVSACSNKQQMQPSMKEGVRVQQLVQLIKNNAAWERK